MRGCLDTTVLLERFDRDAPDLPLRQTLACGKIELAGSNEVLLEYEQVVTRLSGRSRWAMVEHVLRERREAPANVVFVQPQFRFAVVEAAPDDNKFSDCAIAAEADYVITEDRHFDALARSNYPPKPITSAAFILQPLQRGD
jgi:predicted nucleic acid-binding protein